MHAPARASSRVTARLVSDFTVSADSPMRSRHLLGVQALGQQLQDLALALGERSIGDDGSMSSAADSDGSTNAPPAGHRADGPQQVRHRRAFIT